MNRRRYFDLAFLHWLAERMYDALMLIGLFLFGAIMMLGGFLTFNAFFVIPITTVLWWQGEVPIWVPVLTAPVSLVLSGVGWRIIEPVGPKP